MSEASANGVRIILPFVNFWPDLGGMQWYVDQVCKVELLERSIFVRPSLFTKFYCDSCGASLKISLLLGFFCTCTAIDTNSQCVRPQLLGTGHALEEFYTNSAVKQACTA